VSTGRPLAFASGPRLAGIWQRFRERIDRAAGRDVAELTAISAEALLRYKLRTALSVLGVVLGVAAVIAMMSVSEGARQEALQQMELMGLDNIVVRPRGVESALHARWPYGLTTRDAEVIREIVPLVRAVAPLYERYQNVAPPYGRKRMQRVVGVGDEYGAILRLNVQAGRFIAFADVRGQSPVCVLGQQLGRALFGFRDPLSQSVSVNGHWYRVVGVLAERGSDTRGIGALAGRDLNQAVILPISTMLTRSLDLDPRQSVSELWVRLEDGKRVVPVGKVLEHTLQHLHRGVQDFEVVIPRELLQQRYRTQRTFSVVVGSVAALSLIVGGIGIMNIMLASVLERTREIGIRRTVGATRRDVTMQFLAESLLMTVSGGAVGILTGVIISWGITLYAGWATRISLLAVFLGFTVSVAVGLAFGIYPARKAAQLEPVDAMRYE
jgi:putative ABC transport system permease protein